MRSLDSEDVRSLVARLLGRDVVRLARLPGSVANQDFDIETEDGLRLVLKAGPAAEIAAEAWACRHLISTGVPVPAVLAFLPAPINGDCAYLITRFVAGEPTGDLGVMYDLGACFRRVHEAEVPGWGALVPEFEAAATGEASGRFATWAEAVNADLASLPDLVEAGILRKEAVESVRAAADGLRYDGPGVLLHNDLKPAHIFGHTHAGRVRLSAVIDWGDASVGDPAADIARLSMAGSEITAAFLDGYGLALTGQLTNRLTRYRILWNASALSYEFLAGGDWFDVYRARMMDDLELLES